MRVFGRILGKLKTAKFIVKGSPQGGGLSEGFFDNYLGKTRIYLAALNSRANARQHTASVSCVPTTDGWLDTMTQTVL